LIERVSYRWVAMSVFLLGTFMVVLDTTIVNLALPSLQRDFHTIDGVEWVVTSYLAAVGVAQMASSWAADKIGRKRSFVLTLAVFTVGSILCAAAPNLPLLVLARVIQGAGGGAMIPITMAMIYELFEPEERGQAIGIWGVAVMAAPAVGPVLGGTVVSEIGWRWLFLINVPIALVGLPLAVRLLRETPGGEPRRLDGAGLVGAGTGIVLLLLGLAEGGTAGFGSATASVPLVVAVLVIAWFIVHSLRVDAPVIDLRILTHPVFARAIVVLVILFAANLARLVYIPLELGTTRHISALTIGLVLLPQALGTAITMPISGRLTDRIGARVPVVVGCAVMVGSFWPLANLSPDSPLELIAMWLFLGGLGAGMAMMPPNVVAMNSVAAPKVSQATAISQVLRQLSAAVGTAILAAIFASTRPQGNLRGPGNVHAAVHAYNILFFVVFVSTVVACACSFRLPGKQQALDLQAERRDERSILREISELEPL
jgi:EmrB/QacA subfamily drug resistance transporter